MAAGQQKETGEGSRLFDLPAELRNRIYEYTLHEEEPIQVNSALKLPPLVSVCTQIRGESKSIWFKVNKFKFHIVDCDLKLLQRFRKELAGKSAKVDLDMGFSFHRHAPNWPNVLAICHAGWVKKSENSPPHPVPLTPDFAVLTAAMEIVSAAVREGASWEMCEQQLKALRLVAGQLDERWLDERACADALGEEHRQLD